MTRCCYLCQQVYLCTGCAGGQSVTRCCSPMASSWSSSLCRPMLSHPWFVGMVLYSATVAASNCLCVCGGGGGGGASFSMYCLFL